MFGQDVVADVNGVHVPLGLHVVECKFVPDRRIALQYNSKYFSLYFKDQFFWCEYLLEYQLLIFLKYSFFSGSEIINYLK